MPQMKQSDIITAITLGQPAVMSNVAQVAASQFGIRLTFLEQQGDMLEGRSAVFIDWNTALQLSNVLAQTISNAGLGTATQADPVPPTSEPEKAN